MHEALTASRSLHPKWGKVNVAEFFAQLEGAVVRNVEKANKWRERRKSDQ